jgi:hypothetical protein
MDESPLLPGSDSDGYAAQADEWMVIGNGRRFNFLDPKPVDIDIADIVRGLSKLCRYCGQCSGFYSVAQHSVLVAKCVPASFKLEALLHDSAEAYLGDIIQPVKRFLPEFRRMEQHVWKAIASAFRLPEQMSPEVKEADRRMMVTEKRSLFPASTPVWQLEKQGVEPYPGLRIIGLHHDAAREGFMLAFHSYARLHRAFLDGRVLRCDVCDELSVEPLSKVCFSTACLPYNKR